MTASQPSKLSTLSEQVGITVLAYGYAVFLGAAYMLAYWRPFGFSVFPYLTAVDYISSPLNRTSVIIFAPILVAALLLMYQKQFREGSIRAAFFFVTLMYALGALYEIFRFRSILSVAPIVYSNEKSIVLLAIVFCLSGLVIYARFAKREGIAPLIVAVSLLQISQVMAAGFNDGKGIYYGSDRVFFLRDKDTCEKGGVRDWVYLDHFGDRTFFMNTIEKTICITDIESLVLIPREKSGR